MPRKETDLSLPLPNGRRALSGHAESVRVVVASIEAAQERLRRWPQDESGQVDTERAMTALARAFRTLRDGDGLEPWNAHCFVAWLCGAGRAHAAILAGRFVLGVWNPSTDWRAVARDLGVEGGDRLHRFDLFEAIATWDDDHRDACMQWMDAPFWP